MIGIFDSGDGGLLALKEIRRRLPSADIAFFADRSNAPYGTKTKSELIRLVKNSVERLVGAGAAKILMACCTASTVYSDLPQEYREITLPIISPTALAAANATKSGRVAVIATEATVASHAFANALYNHRSVRRVIEHPVQPLVSLIEGGCVDGRISEAQKQELSRLLAPIKGQKTDTLVLGCTHFPLLSIAIEGLLPGVHLVSSAREGALEMIKYAEAKGKSKTLYL